MFFIIYIEMFPKFLHLKYKKIINCMLKRVRQLVVTITQDLISLETKC